MITYQGVVYPAQCDAMGHMNVQFYIAAFDQALWHLMAATGYSHSWIADRQRGWADRRYEIDFRRELKPGSLFAIKSKFDAVGNTSLVTCHILADKSSGQVCAELQAVSVYFDLQNRRACTLPDEIRAAANKIMLANQPSDSESTL